MREQTKYELPEDGYDDTHPVVRCFFYAGMVTFCLAVWCLLALMVGCHLGWVGNG